MGKCGQNLAGKNAIKDLDFGEILLYIDHEQWYNNSGVSKNNLGVALSFDFCGPKKMMQNMRWNTAGVLSE